MTMTKNVIAQFRTVLPMVKDKKEKDAMTKWLDSEEQLCQIQQQQKEIAKDITFNSNNV